MKYIPAIDGLRAIAVLSVIIFHMNPSYLPGGFVGVDIFFVISGFLITKIILSDLQNHQFTLKRFYSKRFRRILPAFWGVLLFSLMAAYFLLLPQDVIYFNKSLQNTLFFWSNHYFANFGSYFAPQSHELPLLHMWSLSVEEQYYFTWPVALLVVYKFCKRHLIMASTSVILISFLIGEALLLSGKGTSLAYYSLPTRCGELMLGALLSILFQQKPSWISKSYVKKIAAPLGIFLVTGSFIFLDETSSFPGINAFYPSFGATLLICSSLHSNRALCAILGSSLFRGIGLISYSLYLWHWPILAYMRYVYGEKILPFSWYILACFLIALLSIISWKWIEQPFRKMQLSFKKSLVYLYITPTIIFISLIYFSNFLGLTNSNIDKMYTTYGGDELCHGRINQSCTRGDLSKKPKILVIGDSHAAHLNYFFDELGKKNDFSVEVVSASSCSPVFEFNEKVLPEWAQKECENLKKYFSDNFQKFDVIVLASHWTSQLGLEKATADPNYMKKFKKTLEVLSAHNKNIYVISQVPMLNNNPHRVKKFVRLEIPVKIQYNDAYKKANLIVQTMVEKVPGIQWVDISNAIEKGEKRFLCQGQPFYMDNHHLSRHGSICLGRHFSEILKRPPILLFFEKLFESDKTLN